MRNAIYADNNKYYSNSELRIIRNKKRRQQIVRRQYTVLITIITVLLFSLFLFLPSIKTNATTESYEPDFKYYTAITVHTGDTIWNIATNYYSENHYSNIDSYISEICSINQLQHADDLKAGEQLIIPYYSKEYK